MEQNIFVTVNGESKTLREGVTLTEILETLQLNPGRLACEVNMEIIKKTDYPNVRLKNGDVVEIVQMIGGG